MGCSGVPMAGSTSVPSSATSKLESVAKLEDAAARIHAEYQARRGHWVAKLKEKGAFHFHKVADELVQVRFEEMSSVPVVGMDVLLQELHACVLGGEVGVVGIYGMALYSSQLLVVPNAPHGELIGCSVPRYFLAPTCPLLPSSRGCHARRACPRSAARDKGARGGSFSGMLEERVPGGTAVRRGCQLPMPDGVEEERHRVLKTAKTVEAPEMQKQRSRPIFLKKSTNNSTGEPLVLFASANLPYH